MPRLAPKPKAKKAQLNLIIEYPIRDDDDEPDLLTLTSIIENAQEMIAKAQEIGTVKTALLELPNLLVDVLKE